MFRHSQKRKKDRRDGKNHDECPATPISQSTGTTSQPITPKRFGGYFGTPKTGYQSSSSTSSTLNGSTHTYAGTHRNSESSTAPSSLRISQTTTNSYIDKPLPPTPRINSPQRSAHTSDSSSHRSIRAGTGIDTGTGSLFTHSSSIDPAFTFPLPPKSASTPNKPLYPYTFTRTYLCGHPTEIITVDKLPSGFLCHSILPPSTNVRGLGYNLQYTLRKCQACATEHLAQPIREVVRNQMIVRREVGAEGRIDGVTEALERFRESKFGFLGFRVGHGRIDEEEFSGGEVLKPSVGVGSGGGFYERATRFYVEDLRAERVEEVAGTEVGVWVGG
ncbi:uncharacterized protein BDR25DRAFT_318914 [Lindgomyces ingoldianus]|uniref:Uncharacterized protein n=1 Tax=Lindgomyces ingoldianus TaxID=673940 RepID=A0ACB6QD93_9PLEO|nr:uncharacterized protein BDR25DRAFT_318914 [Lindgomyces ingoldianus]KAF2464938.1 hypothetical protein BDR25DRAFT_318914 [Lindgomyces ingoldianus]